MLIQTTKYDNGAIKLTVQTEFGQLDGWVQDGETQDEAVSRIEKVLEDSVSANQPEEVAPQIVEVQTFTEYSKEISPDLEESVK